MNQNEKTIDCYDIYYIRFSICVSLYVSIEIMIQKWLELEEEEEENRPDDRDALTDKILIVLMIPDLE